MLAKKLWMTTSLCITVALLAASCSKSGGETAPVPTPQPAAIDYTKESFELVIQDMGGGTEENFNSSYGQYNKKKFPNLKIKYIQYKKGTTLVELTATGQPVDIVISTIENMPGPLFGAGQQYDMTDLIKKQQIDLSKFEQTTIDRVKSMGEGKIYFLPVTNNVQVLYYNKGYFDKVGVSYPKDGMTWSQLTELNKKLTRNEGGTSFMGFSASPNHIFRSNQLSIPLYDPKTQKPTFSDEKWKTLFETYFLNNATDTYKTWSMANKKLPYYTEMNATGELAMMVFNSTFVLDGPEAVKDMDWDLVSLPVFEDKPKVGSQTSPRMFGIAKTGSNKEGAMAVIKYLTSLEMQTEFSKLGYMTVLDDENVKKLIATESQFKNKNWKAVYYNNFAPLANKSIYDTGLLGIITPNILKIISGELDVNTALRNAQEQAEKFIEAEKKK
ncbi:MAG: extracellular solute-binding protein family 1 [Paenibacillus sp.]|jgi:multiple sugar transport system substrate-binding protein|nr:extracellular solute-binding protein family 1 [Paenibacillus sp.]